MILLVRYALHTAQVVWPNLGLAASRFQVQRSATAAFATSVSVTGTGAAFGTSTTQFTLLDATAGAFYRVVLTYSNGTVSTSPGSAPVGHASGDPLMPSNPCLPVMLAIACAGWPCP